MNQHVLLQAHAELKRILLTLNLTPEESLVDVITRSFLRAYRRSFAIPALRDVPLLVLAAVTYVIPSIQPEELDDCLGASHVTMNEFWRFLATADSLFRERRRGDGTRGL